MRRDHFRRSTCEQLATTPFLRWNLRVPALARPVLAAQQQEPALQLVQVARVLALVPQRVPVQEQLREQPVLVQELQRYRPPLQSQFQLEPCRLQRHGSR